MPPLASLLLAGRARQINPILTVRETGDDREMTLTRDAPRADSPARHPPALPRLDPSRPLAADLVASVDDAVRIPEFGLDVAATLAWARETARRTSVAEATERDAWQLLAATAFIDVGAARILEPHVDALRILAEARRDGFAVDLDAHDALDADASSTWGVFAAEGPGVRLAAAERGGAWTLSGTKPWCSLAGDLSHALVTAWIDDERRGLFAVRLDDSAVSPHDGPWVARGLAQVVSAPVDFDRAVAVPVGDPGWYLRRRGFAWGGIGVAAAWWGGACALLPTLIEAASGERSDLLSLAYAGEADAALWGARAALRDALLHLDGPAVAPGLLATRVRTVVAEAVERVLRTSDHALGPGPLATDERHSRRVSDLRVYVRQHHAERDAVRIGRDLVKAGGAW